MKAWTGAPVVVLGFALLALSTGLTQAPAKPAPADIIFTHGVIYTGEGLAENKPRVVSAMAIRGGKVLAVGTDQEVLKLAGPKTQIRDLSAMGKHVFVFPGFNDAHTHLGDAARLKMSLDLTGVKSDAEMMAHVAAFARTLPSAHWITGGNWDHTLWTNKILPTRQELDVVTGGHPAFLSRIDGHIALANSAALSAAGITANTKPPEGGAIDLDRNGRPTGILRESAQELARKVIPPQSEAERRRGLELAIADAVAHGVTSVQDFSDWQDFLLFEQLEKEGKLNLRVTEWLPFKEPLEELKRMRAHHDANDPMLHTGLLKGFMDGSLGSRTAALKAPYSDDPGNTGMPQYSQAKLNQMAIERAQAGFQLGFHAIGDRAVSMALDAIQQAERGTLPASNPQQPSKFQQSGNPQPPATLPGPGLPCRPAGQPYEPMDEKMPCGNETQPSGASARQQPPQSQLSANRPRTVPRNRIEHAQVVAPADISRFKQLGVIASMQPSHLLTDMNWAQARLGPERAAYSYAWKAFLDAGVKLAFGTDYPVEPITPFRGLYTAVTRMSEAGTQSYFPEQKITRGQALYAYTQGSAYAEYAELRKGRLAPGYEADFILVDRDLDSAPARDLLGASVLETYVAGHQVFAAQMHIQK